MQHLKQWLPYGKPSIKLGVIFIFDRFENTPTFDPVILLLWLNHKKIKKLR